MEAASQNIDTWHSQPRVKNSTKTPLPVPVFFVYLLLLGWPGAGLLILDRRHSRIQRLSQGLQASSFSGHFLWHHEASFCLIFVHFMRHHHRPSGPLSRLPFQEAYFSFVSIVSAGTQLLTRGHLVGFTHSASFGLTESSAL